MFNVFSVSVPFLLVSLLSRLSNKHLVDLVWDVEPSAIDIDRLKAIIRNKAWQELSKVLTFLLLLVSVLSPLAELRQALCHQALALPCIYRGLRVGRLRKLLGHLSTSSRPVVASSGC